MIKEKQDETVGDRKERNRNIKPSVDINKKKKNLTFLCFSACFINIVLQYLRQLHNLSNFLS